MAISPQVRADGRTVNIKPTAAIEQASGSSGWQSVNLYAINQQAGQSLVDDNELGGAKHNPVDPTAQAVGLPNPSITAQVAMDLNQMGFWMKSLAGGVATEDEDDPVFQHVFTSGAEQPGLMHIEEKLAAGLFTFGDSAAVSQMTWNFGDEDGTRKIDLSFIARSVRTPVNAAISTAPAAAPARDKLKATKGLIKINGVNFGNVLGGNVTIANGAFFERYQDDSDWPGAIEVGRTSFSCSPEIRIRQDAYSMLSMFDGLTPFALELLYQVTADRSLKFVFPRVVASPVSPTPAGTNQMSVSPTFSASQTDAAPMWTATLRNAVEAYA